MRKVIHLISTLSIIGIISGGFLSMISQWAQPLIAENQKAATEQAIFMVQPEGKKYELIKDAGYEVYKVFNCEDRLTGYALVYSGNGFQGKVKLMIGLTQDFNKITSFEVLEQTETPGLGTKILEDTYRDQFKNLETHPSITWVKGIPPSKPGEVQAITGATISSKAVVAIINEGVAKLRSLKEKGGSL